MDREKVLLEALILVSHKCDELLREKAEDQQVLKSISAELIKAEDVIHKLNSSDKSIVEDTAKTILKVIVGDWVNGRTPTSQTMQRARALVDGWVP